MPTTHPPDMFPPDCTRLQWDLAHPSSPNGLGFGFFRFWILRTDPWVVHWQRRSRDRPGGSSRGEDQAHSGPLENGRHQWTALLTEGYIVTDSQRQYS